MFFECGYAETQVQPAICKLCICALVNIDKMATEPGILPAISINTINIRHIYTDNLSRLEVEIACHDQAVFVSIIEIFHVSHRFSID